jgi:hypothetical protein
MYSVNGKALSLKKVKIFDGNEGMGFSAELYWGRDCVASVLDDAWGGEIMIQGTRQDLKPLEDWAKAQPKVVEKADPEIGIKEDWSYDFTLRVAVQKLFDQHMKEKEIKKIKTGMKKKIYVFKDGQLSQTWWKNRSIEEMVSTNGLKVLNTIAELAKEGYMLVNTNIPETLCGDIKRINVAEVV